MVWAGPFWLYTGRVALQVVPPLVVYCKVPPLPLTVPIAMLPPPSAQPVQVLLVIARVPVGAAGLAKIFIVATAVSFGQEPTGIGRIYQNLLVVVPEARVKVPAPALKTPPVPLILCQVPPALSPSTIEYRLITLGGESHTVVSPSYPAK